MENNKIEKTLLGRKVRIRLEHFAKEALEKQRKPIREMPTITGTLIRRYYFYSWAYIVKLDDVLVLDRDGIEPDAKKKMSTHYIRVSTCSNSIHNGKDPLYLELVENKNKELSVLVGYVRDPQDVPSELSKNDPFLKESPCITDGRISLVD